MKTCQKIDSRGLPVCGLPVALALLSLLAGCAATPKAAAPANLQDAYQRGFQYAATVLRQRLAAEPGAGWGVILDVDGTLLDISDYARQQELAGHKGYDYAAWTAWAKAGRAVTFPGAAEFTRIVREELHGQVVVVTNRDAPVCEATRANLQAQGVQFDRLLCDTVGNHDKSARYRLVQEGAPDGPGPLRVLMWVSDSVGDFPGQSREHVDAAEFSSRYMLMPYPMQGARRAQH